MKEHDPLDALLRELKSPEPSPELDRRVVAAYRSATRPSLWRRFWQVRISVPAPVLVSAALAILAFLLWLRPAPSVPAHLPSPEPLPATTPAAAQPTAPVSLADFQPVEQLQPRIVKEGQ